MRAKATIYSVAERAGVSISTVSLAINHPHRVSAETRRRVAEAAEAEGYRSRSRAAAVRTGLRTIAVAAPFSSWPSYYARLDGVLARCGDAGIEVVVQDLPPTNMSEAPFLDALPVRSDLDGVIVMGTPLSAEAEAAILRAAVPAILVDAPSRRLPSVVFDDVHGGDLVGRHLAELGHRSVLFAHEEQVSYDYVSAGMQRLEGLTRAIEAAGGRVEHALIEDVVAERERTEATAIVGSNDEVAAAVLPRLAAAGLSVPGDVALAGFDGSGLAEALDLTTVAGPFAESGVTAADLLVAQLEGRTPSVRTVTLAGELIVRRSTARG